MAYELLLVIGMLTGLATLAGGVVAMKFRSSIELLRSFSSGVVIGVALFELLPEASELGRGTFTLFVLTTATAVGLVAYFLIDRLSQAATAGGGHHRGHLDPASLTLHSFMDGLAIGLAFHVSAAVGVVIAISVLTHDLLDGVNTVTLSLAGGAEPGTARRWLVADAVAPILGIVISHFIQVPTTRLALLLALFAGFFLYIGTNELLPQWPIQRPRLASITATLLGLMAIFLVARLANLGTVLAVH